MNGTMIASLAAAAVAVVTASTQAQTLGRAARLRAVIRDYMATINTLPDGKSSDTLQTLVDEKISELDAHERRAKFSWWVLGFAVVTAAVGVVGLDGAPGWERWVAAFDVVAGVGIAVASVALTLHARGQKQDSKDES